tara:strand:- start:3275 stop:3865 length:591 start_codon:yes stop_codon:yes gene_type:complete
LIYDQVNTQNAYNAGEIDDEEYEQQSVANVTAGAGSLAAATAATSIFEGAVASATAAGFIGAPAGPIGYGVMFVGGLAVGAVGGMLGYQVGHDGGVNVTRAVQQGRLTTQSLGSPGGAPGGTANAIAAVQQAERTGQTGDIVFDIGRGSVINPRTLHHATEPTFAHVEQNQALGGTFGSMTPQQAAVMGGFALPPA